MEQSEPQGFANKEIVPKTKTVKCYWSLEEEITKVIEKGVALGHIVTSKANVRGQEQQSGVKCLSNTGWNLEEEVTKVIEAFPHWSLKSMEQSNQHESLEEKTMNLLGLRQAYGRIQLGNLPLESHRMEMTLSTINLAALHVICIAFDRGWRWLWLETDSMAVVSCFSNPNYSPPWQLCNSWLHSKHLINQMHFVITHTFREGNMVADILANEGLKVSDYVWWDNPPSCIVKQLRLDSWGVPAFRFH
ncbi:hypothetical protein LWI29_003421 [Acer saccharum]|uniref:RNase H type-1 domain-containing protein n=1 Tax=Acer saccharum TaxID=4024 RepID=A0AA39SZ34_ACESA|nr:hypothetical protein LWI29_003421 [Acer saccharum]